MPHNNNPKDYYTYYPIDNRRSVYKKSQSECYSPNHNEYNSKHKHNDYDSHCSRKNSTKYYHEYN